MLLKKLIIVNQLLRQVIQILKNTDYNTKIAKIEGKIPDTSGLLKKTDYNSKIAEIEGKIPDISNFATKTPLTTVENKTPDTNNLVKKSDYNTKIAGIENNIKTLQAYDLSYFRGKQYFHEGDGKQNYLVFLSMSKYFKLNTIVGVIDRIYYHGNPKDYLMKVLSHLQHLIIVLIRD